MDPLSPEQCQFGFLRAGFSPSRSPYYFDQDLFYYSGRELCHYTDLNGLFGIVASGGFWLSDHRFLNDTEEFENGRNLTKMILKDLSKKPRYRAFSEVLSETCRFLEEYREEAHYVCSFSSESDSLEQWRAYGQNGQGLSIVFDNERKSLSHFFVMPIMSPTKVIYDDKKKTKIILRTIKKFKQEFLVDIDYGNPIDIEDWSEHLSKVLAVEFLNFKHPAYSSEKEVRLIVSGSHLHHFKGLKHRVGQDRIIPYVTSKDLYNESFYDHADTESLPIKEIVVGPTTNQEITARSIEEYLGNQGYGDVVVSRSRVPYRG